MPPVLQCHHSDIAEHVYSSSGQLQGTTHSSTTAYSVLITPDPYLKMFTRTLRRSLVTPRTCFTSLRQPLCFSTSTRQLAAKDSMDKDTVKPEPNEYSKSGSDDSAALEDTAFDPSQTSPEQQRDSAGGGSSSGVSLSLPYDTCSMLLGVRVSPHSDRS